jgi:asparagine synthase (glutamine-hydrolysing)
MCGIAGIISLKGPLSLLDGRLDKLGNAIEHRGPDDFGIFSNDSAQFIHRRLSIIDLSGGHQPMYNEDSSVVVVYNGEIYNFKEIREELMAKGHQFVTQSDTEILVHGYEEEGIAFIEKLNGMFAFALWDIKRNKGYLVRDRFGVKPLFYSITQDELVFSSEINGIVEVSSSKCTLDKQALSNYLTFSFISEPRTIYENIKRLAAGHYLEIEGSRCEVNQYYDLDFSRKQKITKEEAEVEVARLFNQSVSRQMMSDVPVGVMLSGGLDSRSILASANAQGFTLSSFTISYSEKDFDESDAADFWATFFNSTHYKMMYDEDWFISQLETRQQQIGEPYGFFCDTAYFALAEFCKEKNIKVILSGAGGDELFAGYPTLNAAFLVRYFNRLPSWTKKTIAKMVNALPAGNGYLPLSFLMKSFVNAHDRDALRSFMKFKQIFNEEEKLKVFSPSMKLDLHGLDSFEVYGQYASAIQNFEFIDQLSYLDFKVFLSGNLFFSGDGEFMAGGVEQRVPFIDNDLIDFTLSLPVEIRFNLFELKRILKGALNKHVMSAYQVPAEKYKKRGFEIPIDLWMKKGKFNHQIHQKLLTSPFLHLPFVERIVSEHMQGKGNHDRLIQNLFSLHLFLSRHEARVSTIR